MQWRRITAADDTALGFVQQLYEASFPLNERRAFPVVKQLLANTQMHLLLAAKPTGTPVGFVIFWQFEQFLFIEHIAIDAHFRSQGFGQKMISYVLQDANCCLLEVEPVHNTDSEKRIRFYQRLGFHITEETYFQPAYHEGGEPVPMLLLANNRLAPEKLTLFIRELQQTVYSIKDTL